MSLSDRSRRCLDVGDHKGAFLNDLSKVFDCLNHNLLIAKVNGCGVNRELLRFLCSYLKNRTQRTKVDASYSRFSEIISWVLQGSILGPLPFNVYICNNILYESRDADDNSRFRCSQE